MFRSPEQANFHAMLARHMAQPDAPLLLEGGTGLGKTRAYLAALMQAAASGRRITLALPSHQLIDQLLASGDLAATRRDGVAVAAFRPARWFDTPAAYRAQRAAALAAGVLVCTSAAVIIDQRLGGQYNGATTRDYLLFDEADQLPAAAALQSDCEITPAQLQAAGVSLAASAQHTVAALLLHPGLEPETRAAALMMSEALAEPAWYHQVGITDEGGLRLFHRLPGRLLKRIANRPAVAFISATLTVAGQFGDFKRALGLGASSVLSAVVEPIRHGSLSFQVADAVVDTPEWLALTLSTVLQAATPVLVVTPSHTLAQTLAADLPAATLRSPDETASQAAARMGHGGILVAAGAWAGLDTPVVWRSIVVPRVPFERPVVLDGEVETRYLDTRNTAVRRMRQVAGRGLRTPDACCTVYVLDGRYRQVEAFVPQRFRTPWAERSFLEGQRREVTLSALERDLSVRKAALARYGLRCMACGFVPRVPSQLDVHHLNPLAQGGERRTSLADLAVLCANCHRWAHATEPPQPLEVLCASFAEHPKSPV